MERFNVYHPDLIFHELNAGVRNHQYFSGLLSGMNRDGGSSGSENGNVSPLSSPEGHNLQVEGGDFGPTDSGNRNPEKLERGK